MSQPQAVIVAATRTAIGSFGGTLKDVSAVELGAIVIREACKRAGVEPSQVDEVLMGNVLQAGLGQNPARQAAIRAGLPDTVPSETVNKVCGSGLKTIIHAAQAVRLGDAEVVVAGGTESMSQAPYVMPSARWGQRMGHAQLLDVMIQDGLTCAMSECHMGVTAENVAKRYDLSRDAQDRFALESQKRAAAAQAAGKFDGEIVAVPIPQRKGDPILFLKDEYIRADASLDAMAKLRPAFDKAGTVTAANASGINDGAAAVVVCSDGRAKAAGMPVLARIVAYGTAGVDPKVMGLGPVPAVRRTLERAGLKPSDVDVWELNEAFAAQSLAVVKELELDPARVNVHGGAIALGHPIGASGARVLTTLLSVMRERKARRGLAALCIGGGQGVAMLVEM